MIKVIIDRQGTMTVVKEVAEQYQYLNDSMVSVTSSSDRKRKHITMNDSGKSFTFKSLIAAAETADERRDEIERQVTVEGGSDSREGTALSITSSTAVTTAAAAKMEMWRGELVPEKTAQALRHVFDDLKDHFGQGRSYPNVSCSIRGLDFQPHQTGGKWAGDIKFTYNIKGEKHTLDYVGMDVCIDLSPKRVEGYQKGSMDGYGKTWVYGYVPESTMDRVRQYVTVGTGWDIEDDGTVFGHHRDVVAFEAKMQETPEPSFWGVSDVWTSTAEKKNSCLGSIQEVFRSSKHNKIHRGVGIFAVSVEVDGDSDVVPTPDQKYASISFTLISISSWSVAEKAAPIVYDPRKMKINMA